MFSFVDSNVPVRYGVSYQSNVALAANTATGIFTAAANVRGAIVWAARSLSVNTATLTPFSAFLAKATAPATNIDGDVVASGTMVDELGTNIFVGSQLSRPVFVPAGLGLWFIVSQAEGGAHRHALYTLL